MKNKLPQYAKGRNLREVEPIDYRIDQLKPISVPTKQPVIQRHAWAAPYSPYQTTPPKLIDVPTTKPSIPSHAEANPYDIAPMELKKPKLIGVPPNPPTIPRHAYVTPAPAATGTTPAVEGSGLKRNASDYASLAMGAYGAISAATAQKPALAAPPKYQSVINPATGLPYAQMEHARNDIAANTRLAFHTNSSDNGANILQKLSAQANANSALAQMSVADAQAYKQDQQRVSNETNRDYDSNYRAQRGYLEGQYAQKLDTYNQRQQAAGNSISHALAYENQRRADLANKGADERMANARLNLMHEGDQNDLRTQMVLKGMKQEDIDAELAKRQNPYAQYQTSRYQRSPRRGGMVFPTFYK